MKLAFILDPIEKLTVYKDSSIAMMEAAAARGHSLYYFEIEDLFIEEGEVKAHFYPVEIDLTRTPWYRLGEKTTAPLLTFDAVLMRKDPPFSLQFLYTTHLLSLAERQGAKVFNRPQALREYNEKLAIFKHPTYIAPTCVSAQPAQIKAFLAQHQDIILKPLDGMGGAGIFRVKTGDSNLNVILETMTAHGTQTIMAQRYLPEIAAGDKRILLINGDPIDACLARIPQQGDNRGNLAAGGKGMAQWLTPREKAIATELGQQLIQEGLFLVGLDMIGETITEINVTSPTCFREIMNQLEVPVADHFIAALENVLPTW